MLDRLGAILADAAIDASIRVIILAANGPAFCAGHDLKEKRRPCQFGSGRGLFYRCFETLFGGHAGNLAKPQL